MVFVATLSCMTNLIGITQADLGAAEEEQPNSSRADEGQPR
jgi:hypothetical protein